MQLLKPRNKPSELHICFFQASEDHDTFTLTRCITSTLQTFLLDDTLLLISIHLLSLNTSLKYYVSIVTVLFQKCFISKMLYMVGHKNAVVYISW